MKKFFSVGLLMAGFILFCLDSAIFVMAEENMTTVSTSPSTGTSAVNVSTSVEEPSSTISTPSSSETSSIPTDPTTKEPPTTSEKSTSSEKVSITTASNGEKDANLSGNALYRLYHSGLKVHLYTMDKNEYSTLGTRGWKQEGVAWNTSPDKGEPVYRLYHSGLKVHFYTKDAYEYRVLGTRGWRQEGKAFHSFGDVPVYRLYHSGLKRHLYTKDNNEYKVLGTRGWRQEGVAFYALGKPSSTQLPSPPVEPPVTIGGEINLISDKPGELTIGIDKVRSSEAISMVKVAVWSEVGGQDDLHWYNLNPQASGVYQLTVLAKQHKFSYGNYQFHLYYTLDKNQTVGVKAFQAQMREPISTGQLQVQDYNDAKGDFEIVITGVTAPRELKAIMVPVWSEVNGQDDIVWYPAKKMADGRYVVSVRARNHQYSKGHYFIHLYYQFTDGSQVFVTSAKQLVDIKQKTPEGKLSIENRDEHRGSFDVVISDLFVPAGISKVEVPVWSDARGKDDLSWYLASRQADGRYRVTVKIADHGYQSGKYHVHAYVTTKDSVRSGLGATTTKIQFKGPQYNGNYYTVQGKYGPIIIVNKKHPVNPNYNPGENRIAGVQVRKMIADMQAQGLPISSAYSGFRSYAYQAQLYQNYVASYGQAEADRVSARPGYSEHQTGLAFDILNSQGGLLTSGAVNWLHSNMHRYGFVLRYHQGKESITGYMYESWHIRYIGKEAEDIYKSGRTLEEYFGIPGGGY